METLLFWIFSLGMLVAGLGVILNRNPVGSALCLVGSIVGLAGLFFMLHAFLLATIQILVYAGAVMVLFLFIIMLLDIKVEQTRKIRLFGLFSGIAVAGLFMSQLVRVLLANPQGDVTEASLNVPGAVINDIPVIGNLLFTRYIFPFEVIGVLLLVAMIGVILLSKKELK